MNSKQIEVMSIIKNNKCLWLILTALPVKLILQISIVNDHRLLPGYFANLAMKIGRHIGRQQPKFSMANPTYDTRAEMQSTH